MWKCELCRKEFGEDIMAIELKFGYMDNKKHEKQYDDFYTEEAIGPICNNCAIAYIKGNEINVSKH